MSIANNQNHILSSEEIYTQQQEQQKEQERQESSQACTTDPSAPYQSYADTNNNSKSSAQPSALYNNHNTRSRAVGVNNQITNSSVNEKRSATDVVFVDPTSNNHASASASADNKGGNYITASENSS